MKITFFSLSDECARLRLSTIMASIFLIVFGIQGILDLYNPTLIYLENIKLYSIIFISLGIIMLLISCLKKKKEEIEFYSLYSNSQYNMIN